MRNNRKLTVLKLLFVTTQLQNIQGENVGQIALPEEEDETRQGGRK
jgi:hypothetical protein